MNKQETKVIEDLISEVKRLTEDNKKFRELLLHKDEVLDKKIEAKNLPISLEQAVMESVQLNIKETFKKYMESSYNNPLHKIIEQVILNNKDILGIKIEEDILNSINNSEGVKEEIEKEFTKKIAKAIISGGNSLIEKSVNSLKQDHKFRAELVLAVSNLVDKYK